MWWKNLLYLFCLWPITSSLCHGQPDTIRNSYSLEKHAEFLVDSTNALTFGQISGEATRGKFGSQNLISDQYPTWVKIILPASIPPGQYCITTRIEETIHFYITDSSGTQVMKNGRYLPPSQRAVPENFRYICFSFSESSRTIYLKFDPLIGYTTPVEVTLEPEAQVKNKIESNTRMSFVMGGAILVIVLCSLTLYFFLFDSSYFLFAVYVTCSYVMSHTVFLGYLLGDKFPTLLLDPDVLQLYFVFCPLSLLFFSYSFFQMYERPAVWGRIFIFMMVASVICFATIPWYASLNSDIILLYNIITVLLVGVYSFIAYFKYQFKPAAYFLFAFIAPIIVASLIVVDYVGIIAVPSLNLFAGFSFLIQSFILSIGVVSRYQKVNEDLLRSTLKRLQKEHEAKLIKLRNTELVTQNEIIENQKAQLAEQANVLEEMNLTKDKLLTVLAHDLRAPVNNLKAILSLLSNRLMTADEFYGVSAKLRTDVEHVNQMLEEVLQWVKSQHGGIVPRQVEFDLKDQLEGIVKLFLPVANSKNIFMKVEGAPSLKVMADQDHIHIILRNLLSNAIKFSPTGGTVTLKILEDESVARVIITDAGIGMPQEMIENITSGKRILSTRGTQGEKGTGLGLLLCREFIQLNGGEFFIESKEEEGSAVSFTLPKISGS